MSLVRAVLRKNGITFDDFWRWAEKASKGSHKRLFDSYDKALQDIELAEETYQIWLRRNWAKPDLEFSKKQWEVKQKKLQAKAMVRLERIFKAYCRASSERTL